MKCDELLKHMKSIENRLENQVNDCELNVTELNKSITEISAKMYLDNTFTNNKKYNNA